LFFFVRIVIYALILNLTAVLLNWRGGSGIFHAFHQNPMMKDIEKREIDMDVRDRRKEIGKPGRGGT